MSKTLLAHLALLSVALIYGANYTIAKFVLDDGYIQPLGFILFRVFIAFAFFTIIHFLFVKERIERKDILLFVFCGLFGAAINQMFFFLGLKHTQPINASLLMLSAPFLVLVISFFLGREKMTARKIVGLCLGLIGAVILILGKGKASWGFDSVKGDLMILINATSYAIYLVIVKKLILKYNPMTVLKWVFSFGLLFVVPFAWQDIAEIKWSSFDRKIWISFLYVMIFVSVFTYLFNTYALQHVSPVVVGVYIYLQPVFATLVALSIGMDLLTMEKIVAALIIFGSIYLVSDFKLARKSA